MNLATFKPKAYWLVVEPITKKTTKGGIFVPTTAQEPKVFKILKFGGDCGPDVEIGGYTILDEMAAMNPHGDIEWSDHKGVTKLVMVHNVKGFWPASEKI